MPCATYSSVFRSRWSCSSSTNSWSACTQRNNDRSRRGIVYSQCSGRILRPSLTRISGQPWDRRESRVAPANIQPERLPPPTRQPHTPVSPHHSARAHTTYGQSAASPPSRMVVRSRLQHRRAPTSLAESSSELALAPLPTPCECQFPAFAVSLHKPSARKVPLPQAKAPARQKTPRSEE